MSKEETTANVSVTTFTDWSEFLEQAEALLLAHEAESNLIWEVGRVSAGCAEGNRPWVGWIVMKQGKPILAALPSVTGYLILSEGAMEACPVLIDHLVEQSTQVKGVSGPEPISSHFARSWEAFVGTTTQEKTSLSSYSIATEAETKNKTQAIFRRACPEEEGFLRGWAIDFGAESTRPMDPRSLTRLSEAMLDRGNLFVLEAEDELVAMGGFGREAPNGLIINMIYTPRDRRGRGFAGDLTTGLVREARQRGKKYCCLYSEFSSPVRRNLYERIGFQRIGAFVEHGFAVHSDKVPRARQ